MIVSDLYPSIQDLLMGRVIPTTQMAKYIRRTVLEITESYDCYQLQEVQAPMQFQQYVSSYGFEFFFPPSTDPNLQPSYLNKIKAFFIYVDPFLPPGTAGWIGTNSGYNLTYRTIQSMQVLLNVSGLPVHWSRQAGAVWIAPIPDQAYWFQMTYQREHLFPNADTPTEGNDQIFLAKDWQEVVEYSAAQRLAQIYNLSTKASELNARLRGDAQFQRTDGIEGQPGLLFQRSSQEMRDQTTTVKQFRLRMGQSR